MNFDSGAFELISFTIRVYLQKNQETRHWSLKEKKRCQQHGKDESGKNSAKIRTLIV